MKVAYFAAYYEQYLQQYFDQRVISDYAQGLAEIQLDFFGIFGSFRHYTNQQGIEAHLILANAEPLQTQWCKENNVPFGGNWRFDVALEQIKRLSPDVLFIGSMFPYYGDYLKELSKHCKHIVAWISCPLPEEVDLGPISHVFTSAPHFPAMFKARGIGSQCIKPAFDRRILDHLQDAPSTDFAFIGSLSGHHKKRDNYLRSLSLQTPLTIFSSRPARGKKQFIKELFKPDHLFKSLADPLFGMNMYSRLANADIAFNIHIDFMENYAGNFRLFETTGVGAMILTDRQENLGDFFVEDVEVVAYSTEQEAIEKVKYYLEHEAARKAIAKAGQEKTLNQHSFEHVGQHLVDFYKSL